VAELGEAELGHVLPAVSHAVLEVGCPCTSTGGTVCGTGLSGSLSCCRPWWRR
jgi:hypothetical protein